MHTVPIVPFGSGGESEFELAPRPKPGAAGYPKRRKAGSDDVLIDDSFGEDGGFGKAASMRAFGGTLDVYEKTGGHGKRALTRTAGKLTSSSDASPVGGRPPVFMSFWLMKFVCRPRCSVVPSSMIGRPRVPN